MEIKKIKKSLHIFRVEFKRYSHAVDEEVYIIAYSGKQAKKFFYDWWKNYHSDYAIVTFVYYAGEHLENRLIKLSSYSKIEDKFADQQDYIYRKERKTMKNNNRKQVEKVKLLSLEIYINAEESNPFKSDYESNFKYRCTKDNAILLLEAFIAYIKKGGEPDGRA